MPTTFGYCKLAGLLGLLGLASGCHTLRSHPPAPPALELQARAYAHFAAGVSLEVQGQFEAAGEAFLRATQTLPRDPDLARNVAVRLTKSSQWERARQVLESALTRHPSDPGMWLQLGFVSGQMGRTNQAITAYRHAVQKSPHNFPARHSLYLAYVQARRGPEALATLAAAEQNAPADAETLFQVAELFAHCAQQFPELQTPARERGTAVLDRAQPLTQDSPPAQLKQADLYLLLGQRDKAATAYREFLQTGKPVSPLRETVRAKLADLYLRANQREQAVEQLNAILAQQPGNPGAHYFLGAIALEARQWTEAQTHLERALRYNPDFEPAYYDLATTQLALDQPAPARGTLDQLRRRQPATFALEYLTAVTYLEQKQPSNAVPHLQAAEQLAQTGETNRLTSSFYFQVGAALERSGTYDAAARYFEQALHLNPTNAEALNYLGYMWAERGTNLMRARDLIAQALQLEPDNDAFLDSMGWVLYQLGDYEPALEYLNRAVARLDAPDATVYDHLGDVHAARKEMDKARAAWAKSLAIEPNDPVRRKLEAAGGPLP